MLQAIAAAIRVGRPLGILSAAVQQRPWAGEAGWPAPCLTSEGTAIASATLDDNESARHFAALLPLELVLKDYAATEKIADLPGVLPASGRRRGMCRLPATSATTGNLAIFHRGGIPGSAASEKYRNGRDKYQADAAFGLSSS